MNRRARRRAGAAPGRGGIIEQMPAPIARPPEREEVHHAVLVDVATGPRRAVRRRLAPLTQRPAWRHFHCHGPTIALLADNLAKAAWRSRDSLSPPSGHRRLTGKIPMLCRRAPPAPSPQNAPPLAALRHECPTYLAARNGRHPANDHAPDLLLINAPIRLLIDNPIRRDPARCACTISSMRSAQRG